MYTKYTFLFLILLPTVYISFADSKKLSKKELKEKERVDNAYKKTLQKVIDWCDESTRSYKRTIREAIEETIKNNKKDIRLDDAFASFWETQSLREEFSNILSYVEKDNSTVIELKSKSDKYRTINLLELEKTQKSWIKEYLSAYQHLGISIEKAILKLYDDKSGAAFITAKTIAGDDMVSLTVYCTEWKKYIPNGFVKIILHFLPTDIDHEMLVSEGKVKNGYFHGLIYRENSRFTLEELGKLSAYLCETVIFSKGSLLAGIDQKSQQYLSYKNKRVIQNLVDILR